ncbi:MAG: dTDP-4-dehydrorhamnose 3,5-epimerase family protein [Sulfuricella sp.]|nr:dTDP-4-dehydrorhamnose 3,5-epimerase family protein [Sulfuricella sp.]
MDGILTTSPCIAGVVVSPLKQIRDQRGMVMHMLRADSPLFTTFGEVYFSVVKQGVVKAWKRHHRMVQNFVVPMGEIKLVIYDDRSNSDTHGVVQEIVAGIEHYGLVQIPPMLWYGFKGVAAGDSMIANCASIPHDPDEVERVDECSPVIPYSW